MDEFRTIQKFLPTGRSAKQQYALERSFNKLMLDGRVREAARLLHDDAGSGPMDTDGPCIP